MQLEDYTDENGRTHSGAKTTYKSYVTTTENNLLGETDWMYVRKKERNINVPSSVTTNRSTITTEADRLRTAMDAATSEEEVIAAFQSAAWPEAN
jgi:hypothetical protein